MLDEMLRWCVTIIYLAIGDGAVPDAVAYLGRRLEEAGEGACQRRLSLSRVIALEVADFILARFRT